MRINCWGLGDIEGGITIDQWRALERACAELIPSPYPVVFGDTKEQRK